MRRNLLVPVANMVINRHNAAVEKEEHKKRIAEVGEYVSDADSYVEKRSRNDKWINGTLEGFMKTVNAPGLRLRYEYLKESHGKLPKTREETVARIEENLRDFKDDWQKFDRDEELFLDLARPMLDKWNDVGIAEVQVEKKPSVRELAKTIHDKLPEHMKAPRAVAKVDVGALKGVNPILPKR